jgi:TonB family protein
MPSLISMVEKKAAVKAVFLSFQGRSLLGASLVCCAFLLMTAPASAQETKTRRTVSGSSGISILRYTEIPAATEPCTAEECDWWNRLREAGNKLLQKGDQKSSRAFATLFVEGIVKSYKVPLADRPGKWLFSVMPEQAELPAQQRNGTVRLSVEYRADGSVGEIKVLSGMGTKVDQRCIQAARSVIFLPAVKDRQFVTEWGTPRYTFVYKGGPRVGR